MPTAKTEEDLVELAAFGARLLALRNRTGFTQAYVAKTARISGPMLSAWEGGKAEPKFFQVVRLAQVYGVSVDVLAGLAPMPPAVQRPTRRRLQS